MLHGTAPVLTALHGCWTGRARVLHWHCTVLHRYFMTALVLHKCCCCCCCTDTMWCNTDTAPALHEYCSGAMLVWALHWHRIRANIIKVQHQSSTTVRWGQRQTRARPIPAQRQHKARMRPTPSHGGHFLHCVADDPLQASGGSGRSTSPPRASQSPPQALRTEQAAPKNASLSTRPPSFEAASKATTARPFKERACPSAAGSLEGAEVARNSR